MFVLSVGGGNLEKNISPNLVRGAAVRQGGRRARSSASSAATAATRRRSPTRASSCRPSIPTTITPHSEAFQAVVWHLLVSHPRAEGERRPSGNRRHGDAARRVPRPRRRAQSRDRARRQAVSARERSTSSRFCPACRRRWQRLKEAGFLLIVVTNQPDVARGTQIARSASRRSTRTSARELPLDEFPHLLSRRRATAATAASRSPGLLLDAAARIGIDLARSFMVGDRWRDIEAGDAAGCRTVFIDYGYDESDSRDAADYRRVHRSTRALRIWIMPIRQRSEA